MNETEKIISFLASQRGAYFVRSHETWHDSEGEEVGEFDTVRFDGRFRVEELERLIEDASQG